MITVTVSQLNRYVKAILDEDKKLAEVYVKGEISNFNRHYQSGHCYLSLKDKDSAVRAVMFSRNADALRFEPENGMAVIARGSVSVFERDGMYQLYITDMQPDGAGALAVAFAQQKEKLAREGLFDQARKQPLPRYPKRVGVITSETGAAIQDILSVLERRYPLCTAVVCPAVVQGAESAASLCRALDTLDRSGKCDVIIIGRGGGSAEDLAAFNDSGLAYAIHRCRTPVISAVGHETDYTICDFVADVRAPTPSAAAEMATSDIASLRQRVSAYTVALHTHAHSMLDMHKRRLDALKSHRALSHPMAYAVRNTEKLDFYRNMLYNKKNIILEDYRQRLASGAKLLDSLSPLSVLGRGYAITYHKDGMPVRRISQLKKGDRLRVRLVDGHAETVVENITPQK